MRGDFDWNYTESVNDFSKNLIFTIKVLQIHGRMFFYFLASFSVAPLRVFKFALYTYFDFVVRLIPRYLFSLKLLCLCDHIYCQLGIHGKAIGFYCILSLPWIAYMISEGAYKLPKKECDQQYCPTLQPINYNDQQTR